MAVVVLVEVLGTVPATTTAVVATDDVNAAADDDDGADVGVTGAINHSFIDKTKPTFPFTFSAVGK